MGILAVVLAILALACAVIATLFFGSTGVIISAVVAAVAIILAILRRMKAGKGGITAIVISVLAVVLAFGLSGLWSGVYKELHKTAVEVKPDGLWAQISEDTDHGFMGIMRSLPKDMDEETIQRLLVDEANELSKLKEKNN